ncbi:hypothetical protein DSTSK_39290 [Desulforhabdus sp. TSK]|nr:hypothetical protein DSTSK_39290 [Desulforhabdus sp. TSK]
MIGEKYCHGEELGDAHEIMRFCCAEVLLGVFLVQADANMSLKRTAAHSCALSLELPGRRPLTFPYESRSPCFGMGCPSKLVGACPESWATRRMRAQNHARSHSDVPRVERRDKKRGVGAPTAGNRMNRQEILRCLQPFALSLFGRAHRDWLEHKHVVGVGHMARRQVFFVRR